MKRLFGAAITCLALLQVPTVAQSQKVAIAHGGLTLLGKLSLAEGKTFSDGIVLLVHGTLAHMDMEIIRESQRILKERDKSSLAINLSLGVDRRTGPYDCATPHTHRHRDAVPEIARWVGWLKEKGTTRIVLAGHSRGGNQVAQYAAGQRTPQIQALILIAPPTWKPGKRRKAYEKVDPNGFEGALARARSAKPGELLDFKSLLYCKDSKATGSSFLSYYEPDAAFDTPALLLKTGLPTLVVAGTNDRAIPDLAARTRPYVSDRVKLSVIDGAGHFFRDLYLEDVADEIDVFLGAGS